LPGKHYKKGKGDESTTASYADMTLEAAFIFKFLVHNVWPKSHVSTTPKVVTPLIWHICKGGEVDVARIIFRELKHVALSGLTHKATKLSFPGFIMGLVQSQGVQIAVPFNETIVGPIDDKFQTHPPVSRTLSPRYQSQIFLTRTSLSRSHLSSQGHLISLHFLPILLSRSREI